MNIILSLSSVTSSPTANPCAVPNSIFIIPVAGSYVVPVVGVYSAEGIVNCITPVTGLYVPAVGVYCMLLTFAIHTLVSSGPVPGSNETNAPPVGLLVP